MFHVALCARKQVSDYECRARLYARLNSTLSLQPLASTVLPVEEKTLVRGCLVCRRFSGGTMF